MNELDKYKAITQFLAYTLGADHEIVLHWRDKNGSFYIAEIENSDISGRDANSPITGFALELVQNKVYEEQNFVSHYFAQTQNGREIKGSTYFIKGANGKLLGLLCINFDVSKYVNLSEDILQMVGISKDTALQLKSQQNTNMPVVFEKEKNQAEEILHSDVTEIIRSSIDEHLLQPGVIMSPETKIKIIQGLSNKGIFQIKGVLPYVAEIMGISESSVYRYLQKVKLNEKV
ncbi:MAG: PAS domain-containing protein [Lactobacillaceae bacterium]|jgi:predicted transcriptional regulator YheO|nr:PAS domain-containing protein [Lactobacillaceae bacterium]